MERTTRPGRRLISELATHPQRHDHAVQFYTSDAELFDEVGYYLTQALQSGAAAVVLASPAHARGFEAYLRSAGVDFGAAVAEGAYLVLDADETLQQFLRDGRPNARLFDEVVGGLVRATAATGRPVCAYGEMVALLWDDGCVNAAIELEALWNDLSLREPFSLFCSYPSSSVTSPDQAELFSQICCSHSAVIGAAPQVRSTRRFEASVEDVRASRRFVMEALEGLQDAELIDDTALVVSELATNAIVHARSSFTVTIGSSGGAIRIEVGDACMTPPSVRPHSPDSLGGRGLPLIDAVASTWGVLRTKNGKIVWAQLAPAPPD